MLNTLKQTRITLALLMLWTGLAAHGKELPELDGVIEPNIVVDISSSATGIIEKVHVDRSDQVEQGQVLAELESGVEKATVRVAAARAKMDNEIKLKQASLQFDQRKQSRTDELYLKSAIALQAKDEAQTEARLAALQLLQAQDNKKLAGLELIRARELLKQRTVHSPISGVIVERYKSAGEYVEESPILRIAQVDPLRIEVIASTEWFGLIQKGMVAMVTPEFPTDTTYQARVTTVDSVIDAASGTFGIRLKLPNPGHEIPGGLNCKVRFLPDSEIQTANANYVATKTLRSHAEEIILKENTLPEDRGYLVLTPKNAEKHSSQSLLK